jgi:NitT/TauT family transport system permease protein
VIATLARSRLDGFGLAAIAFAGAALMLDAVAMPAFRLTSAFPGLVAPFLLVAGLGVWIVRRGTRSLAELLALLAGITLAALAAVHAVYDPALLGSAGLAFWAYVLAVWALAWRAIDTLAGWRGLDRAAQRWVDLLVPAAFGLWLIFLWEMAVAAFGVPQVLLPAPSAIAARFAGSLPILGADFRQTFLKAVLAGYVIGCGSGFVVAILVDRVPFLQRGLLPLGNLVSALPIVGVAPIMVMWFGFDWPSKAAVAVIMTFFPMLTNTVAGLAAAQRIDLELLQSYGAGYWQTLVKLRLPAALPFIFNALKINSTLALIGAIVAEFFGTPIVGMGFRISTEVGRMNVDMVWAEIVVAALAGSAFFGVIAVIERTFTFWHPSYRRRA